ncbi:MAG: hypothetical protein UT55_C0043G0004 [Candidatus Peregrinibacteria bacterium GW2011_GWE2_39_6]|nr:MAG: hypothetical protein UT36_C0008G0008 [Candidatus Peregrinibacteria bacterium GW2011_GWF2_39_17]KKR25480.1 MAG: hypothetical protein UT55_C0043G0004 [Candidatus Peregrinibacteria bacterium GW2011_GWE2_39_6]
MSYHPYSQSQFNITRLIVIAGLILVAYMFYNLTVTIYRNYQIDTHIKNFEEKNAQMQAENLQKLDDYKYYTSEAYVEKIAKQNMNLVKPGEEVIVITNDNNQSLSATEVNAEVKSRSMANWTNPQKWWEFIFGTNPYKY